jgi:hypothetical protein
MAYTIPEIITWAKICQPLAAIGEAKKRASDRSRNVDLHIELYNTRRDVEYEYAQDQSSSNLFQMGNYLLALCGVYLFQAQATTIGGGSVTPVTPGLAPNPYDFAVSSDSFIVTGASSKTFPSSWIGYQILFIRGHVTQSTVNEGSTYYAWDSGTATLTLLPAGSGGQAISGEVFQIYPVV